MFMNLPSTHLGWNYRLVCSWMVIVCNSNAFREGALLQIQPVASIRFGRTSTTLKSLFSQSALMQNRIK